MPSMGTRGQQKEGEEVVAERLEEYQDRPEPEAADQPPVVDITETDKPAMRFYANLADL